VLGYVIRTPKKNERAVPGFPIPSDLKRRLVDWVDVDEVGAEGFWLWLAAVLPLLPPPGSGARGAAPVGRVPEDRIRELAGDLVDCARERARLTILCERYYADNQALSRRVKALEAALRTFEKAGHPVKLPEDKDAEAAGERYLPPR